MISNEEIAERLEAIEGRLKTLEALEPGAPLLDSFMADLKAKGLQRPPLAEQITAAFANIGGRAIRDELIGRFIFQWESRTPEQRAELVAALGDGFRFQSLGGGAGVFVKHEVGPSLFG